MKERFLTILILLIGVALPLVAAAGADEMTLLYFFSSDCPSCKSVEPIITDINKEYKVEGLAYGQGWNESLPFEVQRGDAVTSGRYGIDAFPALLILLDGEVKQIFRGEHDIGDAQSFLNAFSSGAFSVSETVDRGKKKNTTVVGWILARGAYFKEAQFFITDRGTDLRIKAWLPLEAMKSPFRKMKPRLMSDVINKPVIVKGDLTEKGEDYEFVVKEEVTLGRRSSPSSRSKE